MKPQRHTYMDYRYYCRMHETFQKFVMDGVNTDQDDFIMELLEKIIHNINTINELDKMLQKELTDYGEGY